MLCLALASPVAPASKARAYVQPMRVAQRVCEPSAAYGEGADAAPYEPEGSEHRTLGSVSVTADARWTATLTVPIPDRQVVFLDLERRGPLPAGYRGSEESAHFSVPLAEIDAVATLLTGIVADARRDHVLPSRQLDTRQG